MTCTFPPTSQSSFLGVKAGACVCLAPIVRRGQKLTACGLDRILLPARDTGTRSLSRFHTRPEGIIRGRSPDRDIVSVALAVAGQRIRPDPIPLISSRANAARRASALGGRFCETGRLMCGLIQCCRKRPSSGQARGDQSGAVCRGRPLVGHPKSVLGTRGRSGANPKANGYMNLGPGRARLWRASRRGLERGAGPCGHVVGFRSKKA